VGINPTSLAINYNSGTLLTVNTLSNTVSVVDTQTMKTQATMGIGGSTQFAAAIHPLTNIAVITDQANNRVLFVPLPN
jgi:YVTN family beta-propeller protein